MSWKQTNKQTMRKKLEIKCSADHDFFEWTNSKHKRQNNLTHAELKGHIYNLNKTRWISTYLAVIISPVLLCWETPVVKQCHSGINKDFLILILNFSQDTVSSLSCGGLWCYKENIVWKYPVSLCSSDCWSLLSAFWDKLWNVILQKTTEFHSPSLTLKMH